MSLNVCSLFDGKTKKFCLFKRYGIRYIDYKNASFLKLFINEQGKILPRRYTGVSMKYQRKLAKAIKRARHIAILPFIGDNLRQKVKY